MSNIPNSAMPHAGGTAVNTDDRKATQGTNSRTDDSSVTYGSQYTARTQQAETYPAETSSYQPERYSQTTYRGQNSGSLMEKARDHKTGIAIGVAVGAIAAAAIPFMFSGKKKTADRREVDYSADVYVDNRDRNGRGRSAGFAATGSNGQPSGTGDVEATPRTSTTTLGNKFD